MLAYMFMVGLLGHTCIWWVCVGIYVSGGSVGRTCIWWVCGAYMYLVGLWGVHVSGGSVGRTCIWWVCGAYCVSGGSVWAFYLSFLVHLCFRADDLAEELEAPLNAKKCAEIVRDLLVLLYVMDSFLRLVNFDSSMFHASHWSLKWTALPF